MKKNIPILILSLSNMMLLLLLFTSGNTQSENYQSQFDMLSNDMTSLKKIVYEVKELQLSLRGAPGYVPISVDSAEHQLMTNSQVHEILSDIVESQNKKENAYDLSEVNQSQVISYEQQLKYDDIYQHMEASNNSNIMSFNELMKDENIGKMPSEYKNKILSKLVSKLNNGEITPDEALGFD